MLSHSVVSDSFVMLWTTALQALLSMKILQARTLEWVAMPSFKDLPNTGRDLTQVSCIEQGFFNV